MTEKIITNIMEKINDGQVKPHSKYYFIAGLFVLIAGMLGLFGVSSFTINTLFYSYSNYRGSFPSINPQIPWPALLITIGALFLGLYLFKKLEISYTKSFLVILLVIISTVTLSGYVLSKTNLNAELLKNRHYKRLYMTTLREEDWIQGTVVELKQNEYVVKDTSGNQVTVLSNEKTVEPNRKFEVGECFKAAGNLDGDVMSAQGISRCGTGAGGEGKGGAGIDGEGAGGGKNKMKNRNSN